LVWDCKESKAGGKGLRLVVEKGKRPGKGAMDTKTTLVGGKVGRCGTCNWVKKGRNGTNHLRTKNTNGALSKRETGRGRGGRGGGARPKEKHQKKRDGLGTAGG